MPKTSCRRCFHHELIWEWPPPPLLPPLAHHVWLILPRLSHSHLQHILSGPSENSSHLHNRASRQESYNIINFIYFLWKVFANNCQRMMFRTFRQLHTSLMSIPASSCFFLSLQQCPMGSNCPWYSSHTNSQYLAISSDSLANISVSCPLAWPTSPLAAILGSRSIKIPQSMSLWS